MHVNLGGLQSRRRARDISPDIYGAGRLQRGTAPPGLCLQLQLPAARGNLLDGAGNARERERQFLVKDLEIDSPVVNVDAAEAVCRRDAGLRPVHRPATYRAQLCWRQPAL